MLPFSTIWAVLRGVGRLPNHSAVMEFNDALDGT